MEAKAKAGEEDLSMEEILQSIRKIIADDGEEGAPAQNGSPNGNTPASDVLELTDIIEEPVATPVLETSQNNSSDILNSIDQALAPVTPVVPAAAATTTPIATPPAAVANGQAYIDSLLSPETASAASSAFKKLAPLEATMPAQTTPSPAFNSGNTVETMVADMLRPMLKQWLDANLPAIVERIVEREVRKLSH